ncbi:substrate-binding domain-containing protein, partial [Vibrio parahaemolyticus]
VMDLQFLASRSVDGLLISVSTETNYTAHLNSLHDRGLPIVFFDRVLDGLDTHTVSVDNFKVAYEATEHLIKNGYKRIACLTNS